MLKSSSDFKFSEWKAERELFVSVSIKQRISEDVLETKCKSYFYGKKAPILWCFCGYTANISSFAVVCDRN